MFSDRQPRQFGSQQRLRTPDQGRSQADPQNKFTASQMRLVNDIVSQQPPSQQNIVGQQLLQLTPDEVKEIQRKLQQGEYLQGLSELPQGVQPTHKFVVKIRKPVTQKQQTVVKCPQCLQYEDLIRQYDNRINQLVNELNSMSGFLGDKSDEINQWKKNYLDLQKELESKQKQEDEDQLEAGMNISDDGNEQLNMKVDVLESKLDQQNEQLNQKDLQLESLKNRLYLLEHKHQDQDIFKRQYDELRMQYELECQQSAQLRKKVDDLKREYQSLEFTMSRSNNDGKVRELESQLYSKEELIRKLYADQDRLRSQMENEINSYRTKISQQTVVVDTSSRREIQELKDSLAFWKDKCSQLESRQLRESDSRLVTLRADYEALQLQLMQRNKEIESLKSRYTIEVSSKEQSLRRELELREQELEQLRSRYTVEISSREQSLRRELELKDQQYRELSIKFSNTTQNDMRLKQKDDEIAQWRLKYETLDQRYYSLQQSYETIQITLNEQTDNGELEVLKAEIRRLQKTIVELRSEVDRLLIQSKDNEWLQERYQEQQLMVEQYKAQLGERNSVAHEYTYQVQTSSIKPSISTTTYEKTTNNNNNGFNNTLTTNTYTNNNTHASQNIKVYEPVMERIDRSVVTKNESIGQYISTNTGEQRSSNFRQTTSFEPRVSETVKVQEYQSLGKFLDTNQFNNNGTYNELRRSRAEIESKSQRWGNDYNEVVSQLVGADKRYL